MDVDLSTDLAHLGTLLEAVGSGACDVAIGSRRMPGSVVTRGWIRSGLSCGYNALLRAALGLRVRDAQCGFKAIGADAARRLLPMVKDNGWFFDTELLCHAQWLGLRIREIPVRWVDDRDSRVRLCATVAEDLRGIRRLRALRRRGV
jgi:hypothetical protein